jgi:hypothetical protein
MINQNTLKWVTIALIAGLPICAAKPADAAPVFSDFLWLGDVITEKPVTQQNGTPAVAQLQESAEMATVTITIPIGTAILKANLPNSATVLLTEFGLLAVSGGWGNV